MAKTYYGIKYPFKDSPKGFFLDLTETEQDEVKTCLLHIILTNKGERLYMPDFGCNLLKFLFEPNDQITWSQIQDEIKTEVKKYIPNLQINSIDISQSDESIFAATVVIKYTLSDGVFDVNDSVTINI